MSHFAVGGMALEHDGLDDDDEEETCEEVPDATEAFRAGLDISQLPLETRLKMLKAHQVKFLTERKNFFDNRTDCPPEIAELMHGMFADMKAAQSRPDADTVPFNKAEFQTMMDKISKLTELCDAAGFVGSSFSSANASSSSTALVAAPSTKMVEAEQRVEHRRKLLPTADSVSTLEYDPEQHAPVMLSKEEREAERAKLHGQMREASTKMVVAGDPRANAAPKSARDAVELMAENSDLALAALDKLTPEEAGKLLHEMCGTEPGASNIVGPPVNKPRRTGTRGDTALHMAATNGALSTMKVLIESGANLNSHADSDSFTPLMRTCEHGQVEACKLLLDAGASLDGKESMDRWGHTPLHWALIHCAEITEILIARGAKACQWKCKKCSENLRKRNKMLGGDEDANAGDASSIVLSPQWKEAVASGEIDVVLTGGGGGPSSPSKDVKHDIAKTKVKGAASTPTTPIDPSKCTPLELDKAEVEASKRAVRNDPDDPNWISFTPGEAPWIPFTVDKNMSNVYGELNGLRQSGDHDAMMDWMQRAETVLHEWVVRAIVQSEKRAACFRALGRGWIFLQLSSAGSRANAHMTGTARQASALDRRTRFKWWFEGIDRILRNRRDEFPRMSLKEEDVPTWTTGYVPNAELIFVVRGMHPGSMTISRRKWRANFHREHVWASSSEVQADVEEPEMTPEERTALAKKAADKAAKKKAKRARQKQNKAEGDGDGDKEPTEEELAAEKLAGEEAASSFESLLAQMKVEDAARSVD